MKLCLTVSLLCFLTCDSVLSKKFNVRKNGFTNSRLRRPSGQYHRRPLIHSQMNAPASDENAETGSTRKLGQDLIRLGQDLLFLGSGHNPKHVPEDVLQLSKDLVQIEKNDGSFSHLRDDLVNLGQDLFFIGKGHHPGHILEDIRHINKDLAHLREASQHVATAPASMKAKIKEGALEEHLSEDFANLGRDLFFVGSGHHPGHLIEDLRHIREDVREIRQYVLDQFKNDTIETATQLNTKSAQQSETTTLDSLIKGTAEPDKRSDAVPENLDQTTGSEISPGQEDPGPISNNNDSGKEITTENLTLNQPMAPTEGSVDQPQSLNSNANNPSPISSEGNEAHSNTETPTGDQIFNPEDKSEIDLTQVTQMPSVADTESLDMTASVPIRPEGTQPWPGLSEDSQFPPAKDSEEFKWKGSRPLESQVQPTEMSQNDALFSPAEMTQPADLAEKNSEADPDGQSQIIEQQVSDQGQAYKKTEDLTADGLMSLETTPTTTGMAQDAQQSPNNSQDTVFMEQASSQGIEDKKPEELNAQDSMPLETTGMAQDTQQQADFTESNYEAGPDGKSQNFAQQISDQVQEDKKSEELTADGSRPLETTGMAQDTQQQADFTESNYEAGPDGKSQNFAQQISDQVQEDKKSEELTADGSRPLETTGMSQDTQKSPDASNYGQDTNSMEQVPDHGQEDKKPEELNAQDSMPLETTGMAQDTQQQADFTENNNEGDPEGQNQNFGQQVSDQGQEGKQPEELNAQDLMPLEKTESENGAQQQARGAEPQEPKTISEEGFSTDSNKQDTQQLPENSQGIEVSNYEDQATDQQQVDNNPGEYISEGQSPIETTPWEKLSENAEQQENKEEEFQESHSKPKDESNQQFPENPQEMEPSNNQQQVNNNPEEYNLERSETLETTEVPQEKLADLQEQLPQTVFEPDNNEQRSIVPQSMSDQQPTDSNPPEINSEDSRPLPKSQDNQQDLQENKPGDLDQQPSSTASPTVTIEQQEKNNQMENEKRYLDEPEIQPDESNSKLVNQREKEPSTDDDSTINPSKEENLLNDDKFNELLDLATSSFTQTDLNLDLKISIVRQRFLEEQVNTAINQINALQNNVTDLLSRVSRTRLPFYLPTINRLGTLWQTAVTSVDRAVMFAKLPNDILSTRQKLTPDDNTRISLNQKIAHFQLGRAYGQIQAETEKIEFYFPHIAPDSVASKLTKIGFRSFGDLPIPAIVKRESISVLERRLSEYDADKSLAQIDDYLKNIL